jgi:phospholipase C
VFSPPIVCYLVRVQSEICMDTRREFIKKAALLSGGTGLFGALPASIRKAVAIDPAPGSTYLDAAHIVILMQENRSFDHCYGTLKGVRGFNDPRAITLPNQNLVWLQSNEAGETYAPFRLNIKDTKSTWMSSLPHSWENQVDARNNGKYDKWLDVKRSPNRDYADLPMTLGYYTREDIPFYYSLADAFTVCDQNFCSSLTGTSANRLYFWTGTLRSGATVDGQPNVRNSEVDYGVPASWPTFPERLEDHNISWKVYQNEISNGVGFEGEQDAWLANFTDNPLECFTQYNVAHHPPHYKYMQEQEAKLTAEIAAMQPNDPQLQKKKSALAYAKDEISKAQVKLSDRDQQLHNRAFTINSNDPDYHQLTSIHYDDNGTPREVQVPKGDVLHQFRQDVQNEQLPTVSWLVAPENFSDHPGAPWYGAWYLSEVLDILTQKPEVWKKTIFILAYDENDGDFDHVPPFVPPHGEGTGKSSVDVVTEYVTMEQEMKKENMLEEDARASVIGLGYRVPLVIASPWSRGGMVNSEVFDHTSVLQFLENFLSHKTGKTVREPNISDWRRTVCGDLSSVFTPYRGEKVPLPTFVERDPFIETIHKAQFRPVPGGFKKLSAEEIAAINKQPHSAPHMASQEKGIRPSCALPYELYVDGQLSADKKSFAVSFHAANELFGKHAAGAPFNVYAPGKYEAEQVKTWAYAVKAGDTLNDEWPLQAFENNNYHLRVYGPNGFFREFKGSAKDPLLEMSTHYDKGNLVLNIVNKGAAQTVQVRDHAYKSGDHSKAVPAGGKVSIPLDLSRSFGWYDFSVSVNGDAYYEKRYAGRVESGKHSFSDPAMGREEI